MAEFGTKVVVACPPSEEHDIAALAVAYRCRIRSCRVYYLGANVPIASLANLCRTVKPDLTLISLPLAQSDDKATELVEHLTREVAPASRVAVGGNGALDHGERGGRDEVILEMPPAQRAGGDFRVFDCAHGGAPAAAAQALIEQQRCAHQQDRKSVV